MFKYFIPALAGVLFSVSAQANVAECPKSTSNGKDNVVLFINGISNQQDAACGSLAMLRQLVDADAEFSDFQLFHNLTQGAIIDIAELRLQAQISDRAHDIAQNDYTIRMNGASARYNFVLGKLYADKFDEDLYENRIEQEVYFRTDELYVLLKKLASQNKSITVVAHSQGNFYIEAAIAIMRYRGEQSIINKIRVVGVAPVSSSTPNDVYFSLSQDRALAMQRGQTTVLKYYTVLPANATACIGKLMSNTCDSLRNVSESDWFTHSFTKVYLNPNIIINGVSISSRISDQVVRARDGLASVRHPIHQQGLSGYGDCDAYFWISRISYSRMRNEYDVEFKTTEVPNSYLKVMYRFSITRPPRQHSPQYGSMMWWLYNSKSLATGTYTVTVTKDRLEKDGIDTVYTRTINIGPETAVEVDNICRQ